MANHVAVVRRARILAAHRSGATTRRREQKLLDELVKEFPNAVGRMNVAAALMKQSQRTTEPAKESWVSTVQREARECLQRTAVRLQSNKRAGTSELVVIESSDRNGYVFDALQFPFYLEWETPPPNKLDQVEFHWITKRECLSCEIGRRGWCSNRERFFTPANLPPAVKAKLTELENKLSFNNTVLRVLKMEAQKGSDRVRRTMHISGCVQKFSSFRALCLSAQEAAFWELLDLPTTGADDPLGYGQVFDSGFNDAEHVARRLGQNLGITIWVTQVDDDGTPVAALLSWRKGKEAKLRGDTSLEVGFGEYHTGASSQTKLGPRSEGLDDHRRSKEPWGLPVLEEAVFQELERETALSRNQVVREPILLGSGWLQEYWHPEVLVIVETKEDLRSLPWKPEHMVPSKLKHYDEFRRKIIVPFRKDELYELAWFLAGLPPAGVQIEPNPETGKEPAWVRWSPQGAVTAILASRWYFQDTELLQKAVADVIEKDVLQNVRLPWPMDKKTLPVESVENGLSGK